MKEREKKVTDDEGGKKLKHLTNEEKAKEKLN